MRRETGILCFDSEEELEDCLGEAEDLKRIIIGDDDSGDDVGFKVKEDDKEKFRG